MGVIDEGYRSALDVEHKGMFFFHDASCQRKTAARINLDSEEKKTMIPLTNGTRPHNLAQQLLALSIAM